MRHLLAALAVAATTLLGAPHAARAQGGGQELRDAIDFARRKVYPCLVNISVVVRYFTGGRAQRGSGAGSGVIVSPGGHVLTNFHVAGNTTRIVCNLPSGESIAADVVAHDPLTDLSVLRLRMDTRADPTIPLPFASLGDSAALRVGDHVVAMGNPMALSSSLTVGVVANTGRVFTDFTGTEIEDLDLGGGELTGLFTRWLQHDALILPGNSGGPLVNLFGEVVGINELGGGGMGFAIPSNLAADVLNQVLTFGEVRRGYLGFTVLPVSRLRRSTGALVASIVPGSPAAIAGLQPGDVLLSLDGTATDVEFFEQVPELYQRIAELRIGREVVLQVERNDGAGARPLRARVARLEHSIGEEEELLEAGLTVQDITGPMALRRQYVDADGVLVTGVRPGFPYEAAKPRVNEGDVILSVDGRPVVDLPALRAALAAVAQGAREEVVVTLRREGEVLFSVVRPRRPRTEEQGGELGKAWLGVQTQVLTTELARALGMPRQRGFRVTEVFPWTEASRAGLRPGDVIVALDGDALDASRPQDSQLLRMTIEELSIGEEVELAVLRDGQRVALSVVLEETPTSALQARTFREERFEVTVRDVTFMDRVKHRWTEDQRGVLVVEATMGGWANVAGLRIDDLVLRIGEQAITDVASFEAAMRGVFEVRPAVVQLFVRRGYRTHFVFIEPDWARISGSPR